MMIESDSSDCESHEPNLGAFQTKKTKIKKQLKKKIVSNSNNDMTVGVMNINRTLPKTCSICVVRVLYRIIYILIRRLVGSNPPTYTRKLVCIDDLMGNYLIGTIRQSSTQMDCLVVLWNCRIMVVMNLIYLINFVRN